MNFGFTGTKRGARQAQLGQLWLILNEYFVKGDEFHHGDCQGSDVQAAAIAHGVGYGIVCHPPINPKYRGWHKFNDVMNPETEYIVRDQRIVIESEGLIACPHTPYETIRSGTWTTVRYARAMHRPIWIILPNGLVQKEAGL